MKKIIAAAFASFLYFNTSFALSSQDIPDEFSITEHWISLTTSFDIESKTQKFGTLYRKFFSFLLTYEFYDPYDNKLAIARARFFSLTAHFDIYDTQDQFLGMAEEKFFAFFPTFNIWGPDRITKVAYASMNFWGTTFTIYDPATDREMAVMWRPFIRLKNDWTIRITNRPLFEQRNIDPKVLLTVLAFQGDREMWQQQEDNNKSMLKGKAANDSTPKVESILKQIDALNQQQGLTTVQKPDVASLENIATKLETDYKAQQGATATLSNQEQINHFTKYCLDLVKSDKISAEDKKAILYLLKMRLGNTPLSNE